MKINNHEEQPVIKINEISPGTPFNLHSMIYIRGQRGNAEDTFLCMAASNGDYEHFDGDVEVADYYPQAELILTPKAKQENND